MTFETAATQMVDGLMRRDPTLGAFTRMTRRKISRKMDEREVGTTSDEDDVRVADVEQYIRRLRASIENCAEQPAVETYTATTESKVNAVLLADTDHQDHLIDAMDAQTPLLVEAMAGANMAVKPGAAKATAAEMQKEELQQLQEKVLAEAANAVRENREVWRQKTISAAVYLLRELGPWAGHGFLDRLVAQERMCKNGAGCPRSADHVLSQVCCSLPLLIQSYSIECALRLTCQTVCSCGIE